jgi:hypothetical protein
MSENDGIRNEVHGHPRSGKEDAAIIAAAKWHQRMTVYMFLKYIVYVASIIVFAYHGKYNWIIYLLSVIALTTGLEYDLNAVVYSTEKKMQAAHEDAEVAGFMETLEKIKATTPEAAKDKRH